MSFIREKKIYCNKYLEVDLIPIFDNQQKGRKLSKKEKEPRLAQKNLNDKNSKRTYHQTVVTNFGEGDYFTTLTYSDKHLPKTIGIAEKELSNYLNRLRAAAKKKGVKFKYVVVTEYGHDEDTGHLIRVHHHLIMNNCLDRDTVEDRWSKGRGKNRERIGYVNTRRLQMSDNGFEDLTNYMLKGKKNKKKWSGSRNLKRPKAVKNDSKYSRRKVEKLALSNDNGREYFEKQYPDYDITEVEAIYYEMTGWHIYLKMWRKEKIIKKMRC